MRSFIALAVTAALVVASGCNNNSTPITNPQVTTTQTVTLRAPNTGTPASMTVTTTAFTNGGTIPAKYAQLGCGAGAANTSPDLTWSGAPAATKSFVITIFDPDAPTGVGFWHWLLFNVPPTTTSLAAGAGTNPPVGTSGLNDYGALGYGGPCPPTGDGAHHYHVIVSALDTMLSNMPANTTGAYLTFNMNGHVLAQGTYLGTYSL
jgi:hypothetical protein